MRVSIPWHRRLTLCVPLCLICWTAGCGPMDRPVRVYPPPAETAGAGSNEEAVTTLDELLGGGELMVVLYDTSRFKGKYDGRDGELYRFRNIDWQDTAPEPSLPSSLPSLWGSKKESFSADEIAEVHETQLTARGKWIAIPLGIAGITLFVLYGGIAD